MEISLTKEEMLLDLTSNYGYEEMREYCIPCQGLGFFPHLREINQKIQPKRDKCEHCKGLGFNPKQNIYTLQVCFEKQTGKKLIIKTDMKNYKSICFVENEADSEKIEGSDEFNIAVKRVWEFESKKA